MEYYRFHYYTIFTNNLENDPQYYSFLLLEFGEGYDQNRITEYYPEIFTVGESGYYDCRTIK